MLPALGLLAAGGEHADTDALAHLVWARQLIHDGRIVIAEEGVYRNPALYYPNTVPKPLPLLLSLPPAATGGAGLLQLEYLVLAFLALLASARLGRRLAGPAGGFWCAAALGMNPAWVMLVLRCRPAVLIVGMVAALPALSRWSPAEPLLALTRPEGIFFAGWRAIRRRRLGNLLLLLLTVSAWPLLNLWATGDPLWSAREVRLAVQQMDYPTPGLAEYPLLLLRRFLLVPGPLLLLVLLRRLRRWPAAVPAAAYALLLWASLAGGSLVLPRYLDPLALLVIPWASAFLLQRMEGWPAKVRGYVMAVAVASSLTLWPSTLSAWKMELRLQSELESYGRNGWAGRLAANELLIPRLAETRGTTDLRNGFVALDRAAWEDANLEELGVGQVLVFPHAPYLPDHTRDYIQRHGIVPDTLEVRENG